MGNRRKGDVWKYFRKVSQNAQGKAKVSCTFCGCTYLENATRMSTHLQKCSGYLKLHSIFTNDVEQPGPSNYLASQEALYANSFQNGILMHHFVDVIPPHSQEDSTRKILARAIFACGLPLTIVEEPHWEAVFKSLQPTFVPPTISQLETRYLEAEFCEIKANVNNKLYECDCIGLKCESHKCEDMVNVFVTTPKCYFYKTVTKPSIKCLKEDSIRILDDIIPKLGIEKVLGIVTDTSSNLLKGAKYIEGKYSHIAVYQCAHEATHDFREQILRADVFKDIWKNIDDLIFIIKTLNDDTAPLPSQLHGFISSAKTYDTYTLSCLLKLKPNIKEHILSKSMGDTNQGMRRYAEENEFWMPIENLFKLVEPINNILSKYENEIPPLSHVVPILNSFQSHFETILSEPFFLPHERSSLLEIFHRSKDSLLHPIHLVADFLDPHSKGTTLSLNEQMVATEFIYKLAVFTKDINEEDFLVDLANYKACGGLWGKEYIWKAVHKLHPVSWWNGFCSSTHLSKIAVRIFNLPATSLSQHPHFSSYEYINNELSSMNDPNIRDKLVFVSRNLKLMKNENLKLPGTNDMPSSTTSQLEVPPRHLPLDSDNRDTMICAPKVEKDASHCDNEGCESYKYLPLN